MLHPDPRLKEKAQPVLKVDAELKQLTQDMLALMRERKGCGLAAPQIGVALRLFVTNVTGSERVFLNPVLSELQGGAVQPEGCLSLPEVVSWVRRPERLRVRAWSLDGAEIDERLTGFAARCVQHETDHLDGVLMTERAIRTAYPYRQETRHA